MSELKIPTEIEVAELINNASPLKSIARGLAFERDQLRKENTDMKILLRNYVKAEHNHDEAYDVDRSYTEDILRKERNRVYAFLKGKVDDE